MATQKAIAVTSAGKASIVNDRALPALRDDSVIVKPVCLALNPTDWKHVDFLAPVGCLVGCDYAGIVEEVGKDVADRFKKGDRICGYCHGGNAVNPEDGAFAEHIVAKGDVAIHIPESLSFQEASTLGVGITTVGQGLYQSLKLNLPTNPISDATPILIYGGSTATGSLAIQFAKLSGYKVLTTCSPRNNDFVKSLGADAVYDYNDSNAAAQIRKDTDNQLKLAFDTIALEPSAKFCDEALSTEGGDYSALLPVTIARENVKDRWTLAYTAFGKYFTFGGTAFPAKPEDQKFAREFWDLSSKLLAEKKVKVHRPKVNSGGLSGFEGVMDGMQQMREGKISGEKLVYDISSAN